MLRRNKKDTKPDIRQRPDRGRASAPVFSYYSSRSNTPGPRTGSRETTEKVLAAGQRSRRRWLVYLPSLISLALVVSAFAYLTTLSASPRIEIKTGTTLVAVQKESVYELAASRLMKKSILSRSKLTADTDALAEEFMTEFPELGDVVVIVPLIGRRAVFEIRPAQPSLVLAGPGGSYIIDRTGRPVLRATQLASSVRDKLPVVSDDSGTEITLGKQLLTTELVAFIRDTDAQLKAASISVESFTLPFFANEVHLRLKGQGYIVKLNTENDARQQVGTYLALAEKLKADGVVPTEYIDVRIDERAYYK